MRRQVRRIPIPTRDHQPRCLAVSPFLRLRDVEDLLAHRGVTVSYETIRQWFQTFGLDYARKLRSRRGQMGDTWYLDEVFVTIDGRRQYLWRAVDQDGDLLDSLVQSRRDRRAAVRFFRKGVERTRPVAAPRRHGQAAQLLSGPQDRHAVRESQFPAIREQPSGGLASTDAATRAPDAPVHVCRACATVSLGTRTRTESLPGRSTSTASCSPPLAENALVPRLG